MVLSIIPGNTGLPHAPIPARQLASLTLFSGKFAHEALSDIEVVKNKLPMCLACTALQPLVPRPGKLDAANRPSVVHTLCRAVSVRQIQMDTYGISRKRKVYSFILMMPLRMDLFHFDVRFFSTIFWVTPNGYSYSVLH